MTLSNFLAISISGAAKIELMESESHKQKCELYTWNYVSWCNKRRALVRACVFPYDKKKIFVHGKVTIGIEDEDESTTSTSDDDGKEGDDIQNFKWAAIKWI